jgi:hypothetical protein
MQHREPRNPVAERALQRRAQWEAERRARIWAQVEAGELTEEEAKQRLGD